MSSKTSFLEMVPPKSRSLGCSNYLAWLILAQPEEGLLHQLSCLQPHGKYQIAVTERSPSESMDHFIKEAQVTHTPTLFIQPQPPTFHQVTGDRSSFAVNVISPGSAQRGDLATHFISHPRTANISWIGYQTYLTPPELLSQLQTRYFSSLRLGDYRDNAKSAEPLIRNNDTSFIDLTSIRYCDAPDGSGKEPNGLYAQEICQLARYIGVSSCLQTCYIYGYPKKIKSSSIIARLIAQILWHLFESLSTGQQEDPAQPSQKMLFTTKEMYIGDQHHVLHFVHSNQTGRWWIRMESQEGISHFIPCMVEDYSMAIKGELPIIWLRNYQKFNPI